MTKCNYFCILTDSTYNIFYHSKIQPWNKVPSIPPLDQFYWRTEDINELYIDLCVVDEDRDLLFTDGRVQML